MVKTKLILLLGIHVHVYRVGQTKLDTQLQWYFTYCINRIFGRSPRKFIDFVWWRFIWHVFEKCYLKNVMPDIDIIFDSLAFPDPLRSCRLKGIERQLGIGALLQITIPVCAPALPPLKLYYQAIAWLVLCHPYLNERTSLTSSGA